MEERFELIDLYEYYGSLLSDKEQDCFMDYYYDNLTMDEIAVNNNVSKNAISKELIKIREKLYFYESKLKLSYNKEKIIDIIKDQDIIKSINEYI